MNVRMLMSKGRKIAAVALGAGLLLGVGGGLGGCNNKAKQQQELAMQENAQLRDQNNQLSMSLAQVQQQLAQCMDEKSKAATADTGGGWSDDAGRGGGGGYNAPEPVTITVAGDVLFDSGSATLKSSAKSKLDDVAKTIRNNYGGSRVRVEGYTDSDPIKRSKWGSNEALSQARADAVKSYLQSKGISRITSVGMGSANPKSTKAASRRVEIVISN